MPAPEPGPVLDLTAPRRIHVVGVGGAGMSAYAAILAEMGHAVSGSDLHEHPRFERLRLLGVECLVPQVAGNVPADADAIVISSAVPRTNVEVVAAEAAGLPVLSRADVLAGIVGARRGLGVAGTHGKTTTTSMIALIMRAADMHPSFLVGSELNEVGTNAGLDSGEWLIVEADESDGTFLRLALEAAIVTNIDQDHLWYWGDMANMEEAFRRFVDAVDGPLVLCADDPNTQRAGGGSTRCHHVRVVRRRGYRASGYAGGRGGSSFALERDGKRLGEIRLPVVGRHNAQNAAGAAAMTLELGVDFEAVQLALAGFGGVARRFQHRGELDGVTMIDDYALLPPEIQATIRAAAEGKWRRIIAVFQPFRYARDRVDVARVRRRVRGRRSGDPHGCLRVPRAAHPRCDGSSHRERGARRPSRAPGRVLPASCGAREAHPRLRASR